MLVGNIILYIVVMMGINVLVGCDSDFLMNFCLSLRLVMKKKIVRRLLVVYCLIVSGLRVNLWKKWYE